MAAPTHQVSSRDVGFLSWRYINLWGTFGPTGVRLQDDDTWERGSFVTTSFPHLRQLRGDRLRTSLGSLPGETKRLMERRSMRTIHDHMIRYLELSLYSGISNRLSVVSTVPIGGGYGNTCPECQTRPSERLMVIFATFSLLTRLYIGSDIRKGEKMVECSVAPVPSLLSRPFFLSLRNVPAPSSRQHARFLPLSHLAFLISVIRYL